jgi:hypothetical protein
MAISYSQALGGAWQRMAGLLFRPFDLGRWFVIGFTAWLASFLDSGTSGSGLQRLVEYQEDRPVDTWSEGIGDAARNVMAEAWLAVLVGTLVILALLVGVVMLWIGSRGQFMLLDNLVHRRSEVTRPWREFAAQGDSLFLWQLVYAVVSFVLVAALVVSGILTGGVLLAADEAALTVPFFVGAGIVAFLVVAVLVFIEFFLLHAVVPIMWRYRCPATAAWGRFLAVFRARPGPLVLFGLLQLGVALVGASVVLVVALATCCVGLVLMVLPYVGAVITLPVPVFQRYLDLEFLGRLEPDWNLLADADGSGQLEGDGAVVRPEDVGPDAGGDETGPQDA